MTTIPLFRVQLAIHRRAESHTHHHNLADIRKMIEQYWICPKTVAMPISVTYDGYGRIYHA